MKPIKTKKIRITKAALQAQIVGLQTQLAAARVEIESERTARSRVIDLKNKLEAQIETDRNHHEREVERLQRDRYEAQDTLHRHRASVLVYFMAAGNPETAKDTARLANLQHDITATIPPPINPDAGHNISCLDPRRRY